MRVALFAYHFPPDPAVGSLRAAKVAKALTAAGHEVHVITARVAAAPVASDLGVAAVHVVDPLPGPREVYASLKRRLSRAATNGSGSPVQEDPAWQPPKTVPLWKRAAGAFMWLPDDRQGFILPALRAARAIGLGQGDLIYSTCPPYSPHLAALLLKRETSARWVAEFRDPWIGNVQKPWWVRTAVTDAVDEWLERMCLRDADQIVSVSEGIHAKISPRLGRSGAKRAFVVRNGIESISASSATEHVPAGPVRLAHVGTFSHDRDPRPFIDALATVVRRNALGPADVVVDFIGQCRYFDGASLEVYVRQAGLGDIIHFTDWMPHSEVRHVFERSHILMLLAQNQPDQVPNKLYEYLATRRTILAYADADGESVRMLKRVGGHAIVTGQEPAEQVTALLQSLLTSSAVAAAEPVGDSRVLEEWLSSAQMSRLVASIGAA